MQYGAIYPSLKGKAVLVTGGGSGIGEAIVRHFAAQGSKVGFIDLKEAESKALATAIRRKRQKVHFEVADLADIAALEDVTPEYFDNRIAVNLKHQFFCAQAVVPDMKKAGGGAIVNVTSGSWIIGSKGMPIYVAAKAATYGLVRGLARDLGPFNIRINSIAPGWIMTEGSSSSGGRRKRRSG